MHPICLLCKAQYTQDPRPLCMPLVLPCGHVMCRACINMSALRGDKCPYRCTTSSILVAEAVPICFSVETDPSPELEGRVAKRLSALSVEQERLQKSISDVATRTKVMAKQVPAQRAKITRQLDNLPRVANDLRTLQAEAVMLRKHCGIEHDAVALLRDQPDHAAAGSSATSGNARAGQRRRRDDSPSPGTEGSARKRSRKDVIVID